MKSIFDHAVLNNIPIMLVEGIRSLDDMQRVLATGIDMISLCRTLICEPDLI
ncbi:MAG TPA: hypothetical protein VIK78_12070 [Ruminiclostridium sp.]